MTSAINWSKPKPKATTTTAPAIPATKHCYKCNTTKARTEFYRNRTAKDGLQSICKTCSLDYDRERKQAGKPRHGGASTATPAPTIESAPPVVIPDAPRHAFVTAGGYTFNTSTITIIDRTETGRVSVVTAAIEWNKLGYPESRAFSFTTEEAADILSWLDGNTSAIAGTVATLKAERDAISQELHVTRTQHTETAARASLLEGLACEIMASHTILNRNQPCGCNWCKEARALLEG